MKLAVIKLFTIRDRIKRLADYAINPDKTEKGEMTSVINLNSVATASDEMNATKDYWDKTDKVQGYHIIQSFPPNEVTKELCHEIGRELAKRLLGEEHEIVIGTHLDKNHYHSHIVFNSVNRLTGKKFDCNMRTFYKIRDISDEICREYGLSVITKENENENAGKPYAEWKAEKEGGWTIRGQIRDDIDELIPHSIGFHNLLDYLESEKGYEVDFTGKYPKVRPLFSQNWIRISPKLGKGYTEYAIQRRIDYSYDKEMLAERPQWRPTKHYIGVINRKRPKMTEMQRIYWSWVHLLRKVSKKQVPPRITTKMWVRNQAAHWSIQRILKQWDFIKDNNIGSLEQLNQVESDILAKIEALKTEREELYKVRKNQPNGETDKRIAEIRQEVKILRHQAKICECIKEDKPTIEQQLYDMTHEWEALHRERRKAKEMGIER